MKKVTSIIIILVVVIIASFVPFTALANNDILENNKAIMAQLPTDEATLQMLTLPSPDVQSDHPEIIEKAQEITAGLTSDMDKARAIHVWVASNIWYDNDLLRRIERKEPGLETRGFPWSEEHQEALTVLRAGRGVCVGYANLTVALLRAVEIPALVALSQTHEWYFAFVDNNWVAGDSTWDSDNWFENGRFSQRRNSGTEWFNLSIERISSHNESIHHELDWRNLAIIREQIRLHTPPPVLTVSRTFVQLNDECLRVQPHIINGRTMVPMRVIFEALGVNVEWDGHHRTITAVRDNITIHLMIDRAATHIVDNNQITTVNLDQPPTIINGSTFVPLRFVGEALGVQVNWVG